MTTPEDFVRTRRKRDVIQLYGLYRTYMVHEDTLISQRMQRMLLVQGSLLTAAATFVMKTMEIYQPTKLATLAVHADLSFLVTISLLGIVTADLSRGALQAAMDALHKLSSDWRKLNESWKVLKQPNCDDLHLPGIIGGGHPEAHPLGLKHVVVLPMFLEFLWSILMVGILVFWIEI